MRTQSVAFAIFILIMTPLLVYGGAMTDEEFYSNAVDDFIKKCDLNSGFFVDSSSSSLQKSVALNVLKASYVKYFKNDIVVHLLINKRDIDRKEYKINHYINSLFFDVFRVASGEETSQ